MKDDEEELERAKHAEQKQMSEIDKDMRKLDDFKSQRMSKKNDLDNMDEEIAKAKELLSKNVFKLTLYLFAGSSWCWKCSQGFTDYSEGNYFIWSKDRPKEKWKTQYPETIKGNTKKSFKFSTTYDFFPP